MRERSLRASPITARLLLVLLACAISAVLLYVAPPGPDLAEHAFQQRLYEAHGLLPWNNLWYSGRYSFLSYSVAYYPLAALLGIRPLAIACVAVGVCGVHAITSHRWPGQRRWVALSAACIGPTIVVSAEFPFLLGAATGLAAVAALDRRRWWLFGAACVLTAAASPLAFVLLTLTVVAVLLGDRRPRRVKVRALSLLALVALAVLGLARAFPSGGSDPFPLAAFVPTVVFAGAIAMVTRHVRDARPVHLAALLYLAACTVLFAVPTEIGEGITRIRAAALPVALLVAGMRDWRPRVLCAALVALAAYCNLAGPVQTVAAGLDDPAGSASFWQPAAAFLRRHLPPSYRVEVVDTRRHWAAFYLPKAGIPLVRGWFRQDDFPQNRVLYRSLRPAVYRAWLQAQGVLYVVLTDARPDYSAVREAQLVRDGRAGLEVVARFAHLAIYRVPTPRSIIVGPGHPRVLTFDATSASVRIPGSGAYRIAVHWSPYWAPSRGCLSPAGDGMVRLSAHSGGVVRLSFRVTLSSLLHTVAGRRMTPCARRHPDAVNRTRIREGPRPAARDTSVAWRSAHWAAGLHDGALGVLQPVSARRR
jgi:hypothetical protein